MSITADLALLLVMYYWRLPKDPNIYLCWIMLTFVTYSLVGKLFRLLFVSFTQEANELRNSQVWKAPPPSRHVATFHTKTALL